ncbi:MAG: carboxypeptidase-like regulatory domain-containing protein [Bacteroidia bacterium]|jgi:hypothetical protein
MNVKLFFCFLLGSLPAFLIGQQYTGIIKSKKNNEGLPYVNIGIPAKAWGFRSDEKGVFTFKVTSEKDTDTVQFSLIGYQTAYLPIKELKEKCASNSGIYLDEMTYDLAPVTILPNDYEVKVLGSENPEELDCFELPRYKDTTYSRVAREKGLDTNSVGIELGNKIPVKEGQRTFIDKVQFKVCLEPKDTAIYRINVYTKGKNLKRHITPVGMVREQSFVNIMKEPVVIKCIGKTEVITIDLSSQDIEVNDDFYVALECIYASDKKIKIGVSPALFSSTDVFIRLSLFSEWLKLPVINLTFISATVSSKKMPGFWERLFR